jgi:hypothetical protein
MSVLDLVDNHRVLKNILHLLLKGRRWLPSRRASPYQSSGIRSGETVAVRDPFSAMFGLGSRLRFYSSRPFHPCASVIEKRIASEVSL